MKELIIAYNIVLTASIMKTSLFTILTALVVTNVSGQISFSTVDAELKIAKSNSLTQIVCSNSTMSVMFELQRDLTLMQQKNFVAIDSQTIQIIPLKFRGYQRGKDVLSLTDQKQLLDSYSKYEMFYFKNELQVEVINPNSQWVVTKSKGWLVWYFRVHSLSNQNSKRTTIQLFASTVVGDKVLTINAPIQTDDDFTKAGQIINEMMETLTIARR